MISDYICKKKKKKSPISQNLLYWQKKNYSEWVCTFFLSASSDSNSSRASWIWMCLGTSGMRKAMMNFRARSPCWNHRMTTQKATWGAFTSMKSAGNSYLLPLMGHCASDKRTKPLNVPRDRLYTCPRRWTTKLKKPYGHSCKFMLNLLQSWPQTLFILLVYCIWKTSLSVNAQW